MNKVEFKELLTRYVNGSCSAEEITQVNLWYDYISDEDIDLSEIEKIQIKNRISSSLIQSLPPQKGEKKRAFVMSTLKIAASLTLFLIAAYFLRHSLSSKNTNQIARDTISSDDFIVLNNDTQQIMKVKLPDGSGVQLYQNTQLSYSKTWVGQKREVNLVGEAFFEVIKDSSRPFYVYSGEVTTKVLGTSFKINAHQKSKFIQVAVQTGKVSVFETPKKSSSSNGVVLTPNEKVEYFIEDKHWVTSLVEVPKVLPTVKKEDFIFNNTPIQAILDNIQDGYAISIITDKEAANTCTFTGDVSSMELYDMLNVICKAIGATYEVKGTKILFSGNGCNDNNKPI
jgi:ferric-dicitrate binding protein FerR (iron transport regulator)